MLLAAVAGALAALATQWAHVTDYTVRIDAREVLRTRTQSQVLLYSYRRPDRAKLEIVGGAQRGAIVLWDGDDRATAYRRGLRLFKLRVGARDERVTSLRGKSKLSQNKEERDRIGAAETLRERDAADLADAMQKQD